MPNASLKPLLASLLLTGCATTPQFHSHQSRPLTGFAEPDNIRIATLATTPANSIHLVQIRNAEPLHIHARHDLTVFLQQGHGMMRLADRTFPIAAGDVLLIPAGTPHAFENRGRKPARAVAVFTPPFDGQDTVPVAETK
jgi:mannose-6-phosphate isomerase-like protein (cupin superfamily)